VVLWLLKLLLLLLLMSMLMGNIHRLRLDRRCVMGLRLLRVLRRGIAIIHLRLVVPPGHVLLEGMLLAVPGGRRVSELVLGLQRRHGARGRLSSPWLLLLLLLRDVVPRLLHGGGETRAK
jgi:hypothetical protein